MRSFNLPFFLTVAGMLFYHLSQKFIPKGMNPFLATAIAYMAGIVVCVVCAFTYPGNRSLVSALKESNWAVYVVCIAAACIEVGFMLAYRAGWRIGGAAVSTNVASTAMLGPIGLIIFKDQLS